jgi:hypothetical protein
MIEGPPLIFFGWKAVSEKVVADPKPSSNTLISV